MRKSPDQNTPSASPSMNRVMQMLLGFAVLALVVGGMVVMLMNTQISELQQTASDREAKVGNNEQIARRYLETRTKFEATQAHAQFLEASVSAKSYVPTLLQQLQGLAASTNLIVNAVRPGMITAPVASKPAAPSSDSSAPPADVKKSPPAPYDTLTIDVDVTGSYSNTVAFLYGLTRFPKIISVTGLQIKPGAADQSAKSAVPLVSTSLHLTAFVFHDETGASPAASGVAAIGMAAARLPEQMKAPGAVDAEHAAAHATGANKAAQARSEVGVNTL